MMPKHNVSDRDHHVSESAESDVEKHEEEAKIEGTITKQANVDENHEEKEADLIVDQI